MTPGADRHARRLRVRGVVQGVGFRPWVFRLAHTHGLSGWVRNTGDGVEIHVEGRIASLDRFAKDVERLPPAAARVASLEVETIEPAGHDGFEIRESGATGQPTTRISPDLPVCGDCLAELGSPADRRARYPYITCTNCGPRYSIVRALPYDRALTTMADWPMCDDCAREYHDPGDRRFHAQPIACPACGPDYVLTGAGVTPSRGPAAMAAAATLLHDGRIVALKGIGGYHLACAARNADAVQRLRERKFRKERPFAVMARDLAAAERLAALSPEEAALLTSPARPIVLAQAREALPLVAPDNDDIGLMLPYAPLHAMIFAAGAPEAVVLTSGNRSSEPIAFEDDDARVRLADLADAILAGERPIARRVDDSVVRSGARGPVILRRSRGFAPAVVASLPGKRPLLALGADLKNTIALVIDGEAVVSQHIGDLEHYDARRAFEETVRDLAGMWQLDWTNTLIVHDAHPQYVSSQFAASLTGAGTRAVQHHRAHVASVLAERGAFEQVVVGVAFDGTGYGDDGTIWGGELFAGSVAGGFQRAAHLRPAPLPGGDAAARYPVQAAAGFLSTLEHLPDLSAPPFELPQRYEQAVRLARGNVRVFTTTSAGRLFDTAAALLGFTREQTFEGQAAMWLEQRARRSAATAALDMPFIGGVLDYRPALEALIAGRVSGADACDLARAFHQGLAAATARAVEQLCETYNTTIAVVSGGVFQNELLLSELAALLDAKGIDVWSNHEVPPNDGGISLGQAAMGSFG